MSVMYIRNEQTGEFEPVPSLVGPPGANGGGAGTVTAVNNVAPDTTGNVTLTAADVGALPKDGTAANANALNGKSADQYALKTDTAADSEKLGGVEASEYVLHSAALSLEEIKASTDLTGKIPDAAAMKTIAGSVNQAKFDSAYNLQQLGITVPETWGSVLRLSGQNWGTTFVSDSYFLCISSGGDLYVGTQVNGTNDITWKRLAVG